MANPRAKYDVFVSYRWAEPDMSWVRNHLAPQLTAAGLHVCIDIDAFVPGRHLILEMERAGQESQRALCIMSPDYFEGNRMVSFESLAARLRDPAGIESRLIPLLFRPANIPDWLHGLISVDWTDHGGREREWRKLLEVLNAPRRDIPPPPPYTPPTVGVDEGGPQVTWIHDYLRPQHFIGREEDISWICSKLEDQDGASSSRIIAVTAIGGVGKSCLARMAIENRAALQEFNHVIWFSFYEARTEDDAYFFTEVLDAVGMETDTGEEGARRARELRRRLAKMLGSRKCLLVLDGFEVVQQTQDPESGNYGKIAVQHKELQNALTHLLNATNSKALVTTRTPLRDFENAAGFNELELRTLPPEAGADLLRSLGVRGEHEELIYCANLCGGHPLCLTAAGKYMERRNLAASQIEELTGDGRVFQGSSEGEKVRRIVEQQRQDLPADQEHFLTMLSLHSRSVTEENFPVLIKDFGERPRSAADVMDEIIIPLSERGLVDILETAPNKRAFSVHPLMKLAYSSWLQPKERMDGHKIWADAAAASPVTYGASSCQTLEELQPFIDATAQYLLSGDIQRAWSMFHKRGTAERLDNLGYFAKCFEVASLFAEALDTDTDTLSDLEQCILYDRLARTIGRFRKQSESLQYRRKQLEAAKRDGQAYYISRSEDLLIETFLTLGQLKKARESKTQSRKTIAKIALCKGSYGAAARLLRKEYRTSYDHDKTVGGASLGEALFRQAAFEEADQVLLESFELAQAKQFTCCQLSILGELVELELKRGDLRQARTYQDKLNELRRTLALDASENSFLLIAEGDSDLALTLLLEEEEDVENPNEQISNLLARAAAKKAKCDFQQARLHLIEAEQVMEASGCKRLRDVAEGLWKGLNALTIDTPRPVA